MADFAQRPVPWPEWMSRISRRALLAVSDDSAESGKPQLDTPFGYDRPAATLIRVDSCGRS